MDTLANIHWGWFLAGLAVFVVNQAVGYQKWNVMYLSSMEDRTQPLFPIFCSVLVLGMLTPARAGDILASLTWKKLQGKVLAWSLFHRISEGLTTIFLSFLVLGLFFGSYYEESRWKAGMFLVGLVLIGIAFVLNERAGRTVFRFLRALLFRFKNFHWASRFLSWEERVKYHFELFHQTMARFRRSHTLGLLVFITFAGRGLIIIVNMCILRSLGVDLTVLEILGILAATWVSSFLAPTPGGIGIGDIAPSMILTHFGYEGSAGAFILINRILEIIMIAFWSTAFAVYRKPARVVDSRNDLAEKTRERRVVHE